jgi:starch synthase
MPDTSPNFALFYSDDGYSTKGKIMGRQSAGSALLKGIARRWPGGEIVNAGTSGKAGARMQERLRSYGHTGRVRWYDTAGEDAWKPNAVYYPAPPEIGLAHNRNRRGVTSYSLFGVTHTLSSGGAMDQVAGLVLPPYQPWDALICTSHAALVVVGKLQDDIRGWMREHSGATRFNPIQTPVIPLGVDAPAFTSTLQERAAARAALNLEDAPAFLFAGRLTFHAKANPIPFYQAIQAACKKMGQRLTVIEAGIYPNDGIRRAFEEARSTIAPLARFIHVDGRDEARYRVAWQAADVFVSLSDNIQETFGLTPLEAMAAGLPVLVSDWNGYKDTVRDGLDGFRIPTLLPPGSTGNMIAARYALGIDSYDYYIGRTSLATAINQDALAQRTFELATDEDLRQRLGENARRRATEQFDWPVILNSYVALADELRCIREAAPPASRAWPSRPDPFTLFSHYATAAMNADWKVAARDAGGVAIDTLLELTAASYAFDAQTVSRDIITATHHALGKGEQTIGVLLSTWPGKENTHLLALMWLIKFGLAAIQPQGHASWKI